MKTQKNRILEEKQNKSAPVWIEQKSDNFASGKGFLLDAHDNSTIMQKPLLVLNACSFISTLGRTAESEVSLTWIETKPLTGGQADCHCYWAITIIASSPLHLPLPRLSPPPTRPPQPRLFYPGSPSSYWNKKKHVFNLKLINQRECIDLIWRPGGGGGGG